MEGVVCSVSNVDLENVQEPVEFYFQYSIIQDRAGLLGDIASLLGMLGFNIIQLGGISELSRGFLLKTCLPDRVDVLRQMVEALPDVRLDALRKPSLRDRISLRHGRVITRSDSETRTYRFIRDELGILVDFLGELLQRPGRQIIGVRGQPRVGKTESIVAASVYANKRWIFVSSTLLKQTILHELPIDEDLADNVVYIIDGAVSTLRGDERHLTLLNQVLSSNVPIVIEHPDIFVKRSYFNWDLFDLLIELRRDPLELIQYEQYEQEAAQWQE
jgi:hypothetical protein